MYSSDKGFSTKNAGEIITAILLLFSFHALFAQSPAKTGKLYKTISDYANDRPMAGYDVAYKQYNYTIFGGETFYVSENNSPKYKALKVKRFPTEFFTYNDFLIRIYKNKAYIVLSYGSLCFYSQYSAQAAWYYSETPDGEFKKFNQKKFEEYLTKYGLLESYKKDAPFLSSDANTNLTREVAWRAKYFNLLNEKMK